MKDENGNIQTRRILVLKLREEGKTHRQIAEIIGVASSRVGQIIKGAKSSVITPPDLASYNDIHNVPFECLIAEISVAQYATLVRNYLRCQSIGEFREISEECFLGYRFMTVNIYLEIQKAASVVEEKYLISKCCACDHVFVGA